MTAENCRAEQKRGLKCQIMNFMHSKLFTLIIDIKIQRKMRISGRTGMEASDPYITWSYHISTFFQVDFDSFLRIERIL